MINKPYAESCDQNRAPILRVIRPYLADCRSVLEIGSGTGQHAVHFGAALPHLRWQTSDLREAHAGIRLWLGEAGLANVLPPIDLELGQDPWPETEYDAVFSANSVHIMGKRQVAALFDGVGGVLRSGGPLMLYGPFNYGGRYTSDSNAHFDQWLQAQDPASGIRDVDWLNELAASGGLEPCADHEMPVNNRILVWRRL